MHMFMTALYNISTAGQSYINDMINISILTTSDDGQCNITVSYVLLAV